MARRPLLALSVAYFLFVCAATDTTPLWPVFVTQLGGGPAATSIVTGTGLLASVGGALLIGWLTSRIGHRKPLFFPCIALNAATWWLMVRAPTWQAVALMGLFGGLAGGRPAT